MGLDASAPMGKGGKGRRKGPIAIAVAVSALILIVTLLDAYEHLTNTIEIERRSSTQAEERAIEAGEATDLMDLLGTPRFVNEHRRASTNDSGEALDSNCRPLMIDGEVIDYYTSIVEEARRHLGGAHHRFSYACSCERFDEIRAENSTFNVYRFCTTVDGQSEWITFNGQAHLVLDRWDQGPQLTVTGGYVIDQEIDYSVGQGLAGSGTWMRQVLVLDSEYRLVALIGPVVMESVA